MSRRHRETGEAGEASPVFSCRHEQLADNCPAMPGKRGHLKTGQNSLPLRLCKITKNEIYECVEMEKTLAKKENSLTSARKRGIF